MHKKQHIVPYGDRWAIRAEGNIRVSSTYSTKKEAIITARKMVCHGLANLIVHYRNGKVIKRREYGRRIRQKRCR